MKNERNFCWPSRRKRDAIAAIYVWAKSMQIYKIVCALVWPTNWKINKKMASDFAWVRPTQKPTHTLINIKK